MLTVLFWVCVALDAAALGLFFLLSLAAAGSSGDSPATVAFTCVLLALPLVAAVVFWVRGGSTLGRAAAFLVAAAPPLAAAGAWAYSRALFDRYTNADGELTFFAAGPSRELVDAIRRNDAARVAELAKQVDVNAAGLEGMTPLVAALRQLRETPQQHDVLQALLAAGADPNQGTDYEMPLAMALQVARQAGSEPVRLLLDAGADPNRTDSSGTPIWFGGAGNGIDTAVLQMLLDHGADLDATGRRGERPLFYAADARNWPAVLLLLDRGADPRLGRSLGGQTLEAMLASNASWASTDPGYADVVQRLRAPAR
jgi:hypothetical protein